MPELKFNKIQLETESWKRSLGFMAEENTRFKNKLSEILKDRFDKNLLEEVDNFQSRFIKEDALIHLLRNDVAEMERLLEREAFEYRRTIKEIDKSLKKLRNNMRVAENQFGRLKSAFNNFLSENIL